MSPTLRLGSGPEGSGSKKETQLRRNPPIHQPKGWVPQTQFLFSDILQVLNWNPTVEVIIISLPLD